MSEKVFEWLLEENNPSVKYFTLTSLLEKDLNDPLVIKTQKEIMGSGIVPKILAKQNSDGSWGVPERFYDDKYTGTAWTLLVLSELAANPDDQRIKKACEFMLDHSQDSESGGFAFEQSNRTGKGIPSSVVPCLTGNMVYALIKFGYLNDSRVQKAIEWICRYQRSDDGGERPPLEKIYEKYKVCWGLHSCHMGVAKNLKALTAVPEGGRSQEITKKIDELAEYFLKHHIYKKSRNLEEVSKPGWLKFGFPLMYQTDVLELLGIFADLKIKDPRLEDAIKLLENKKTQDSLWKMENTYNGKMLVSIEKKGSLQNGLRSRHSEF